MVIGSKVSLFSELHDSAKSVIARSGVIAFSVKVGDIVPFLGDILGAHGLGIEESSLNIKIITSVLCHLSLATKPPPTSKTLPVSWHDSWQR